jgi:hypothetical protein
MMRLTAIGPLILTIVFASPSLMLSMHASADQAGEDRNVVTGTLEELDLTRMKGSMKTDLGKPIFFEVTKPELFKGRSVGERVTIQLDDQGRATKVIDALVPEMKKPLN